MLWHQLQRKQLLRKRFNAFVLLRVLVHALLLSHFPSLFFETGSHYLAEAGIEFPECWDHRYGPPRSSKKSLLGSPPTYLRSNFGSV